LRGAGNTVIVIEHDLQVIQSADQVIDMGPGAGVGGGQIVAQGSPAHLAEADSITGRWLLGKAKMPVPQTRRKPYDWMEIINPRANNLKGEIVRLPLDTLIGICGVSGSGKSTLMVDTVGRALAPRKHTTSVAYEPIEPGEHDAILNAPPQTILVDQTRRGISSPAAFLGLERPLRQLYAGSPQALTLEVSQEDLAKRCSVCHGRGFLRMEMGFLPDVRTPCETCQGTGLPPVAWEVTLDGLTLPQLYELTLDQVYPILKHDPRLEQPLRIAQDVGLGYLVLRQPAFSLSGGEVQRLKIVQQLCRPSTKGTLYILDEPSVGQHLEDLNLLLDVLNRLVHAGNTVVIVEHHPHLLVSCDWLVELGPGGGPQGGHLIAQGTPEQLAAGDTPISTYLREILSPPYLH
jgi:excinuclease ABC subunit A